jgi:uncharacterized protein (TIGR04141 family)
MPQLTLYRIRDSINGHRVRSFDSIVDLEDRASVDEYGPISQPGFQAKLFVSRGQLMEVPWAGLLRQGFSEAQVPKLRSVGALLLIKTSIRERPSYFALPFGPGGRFLLKQGSWERGYGLRTALNVIYEGDDGSETYDVSRLRAVEAKKVGENTIRSRHQANHSSSLDAFDVDIRRDLLSRIDGPPRNTEVWGTRVGGADALAINKVLLFSSLGQLCRLTQGAFETTDYKTRFAWVDNTRAVDEPGEIESAIQERLKGGGEGLDLVVPQLIDWERIEGFQLPIDRRGRLRNRAKRLDLRLEGYLASLGTALADISVTRLKSDDVFAVDADGQRVYRWSVWQCLAGEIHIGDEVFVIDEGTTYQVSRNYRDDVNSAVEAIPEWDRFLPNIPRTVHEKEFNQRCADENEDLLNMDRNLARSSRGTSPVEVCDLLSSDGSLIHVKRGWGSSLLSHLFNQGATSAELLTMDSDFRADALAKIQLAEAKRLDTGSTSDVFGRLVDVDNGLTGSKHVVFAIIGEWTGRSLAQALPFFAKVNLWETAERLRRMGFHISHSRVEAVPV